MPMSQGVSESQLFSPVGEIDEDMSTQGMHCRSVPTCLQRRAPLPSSLQHPPGLYDSATHLVKMYISAYFDLGPGLPIMPIHPPLLYYENLPLHQPSHESCFGMVAYTHEPRNELESSTWTSPVDQQRPRSSTTGLTAPSSSVIKSTVSHDAVQPSDDGAQNSSPPGTSTKPITCTKPGCPQTFGRRYELERHCEDMHGEASSRYKCGSCPYRSTSRKDLVKKHEERNPGHKCKPRSEA